MNPVTVSLLIFFCVCGLGLGAMRLRSALPEHHLSADTKDTVKLAMGLVATMTALILGLMVASAKTAYDAEKSDVTTAAVRFVVLDRILAHYGPEATATRDALRLAVERMVDGLWPHTKSQAAQLEPSTALGDALYEAIHKLSPQDDARQALKSQALDGAVEVGELRWLLYFQQTGRSISVSFLVIVVLWLSILFVSFGLFAPANGTAKVALLVSALSVSAAIFLILELDHPFDGLISIPSNPMQRALAHLGK